MNIDEKRQMIQNIAGKVRFFAEDVALISVHIYPGEYPISGSDTHYFLHGVKNLVSQLRELMLATQLIDADERMEAILDDVESE